MAIYATPDTLARKTEQVLTLCRTCPGGNQQRFTSTAMITNRTTPLANVFTLGVRDFPTLREFYGALGWKAVIEEEGYAAFELRGAVLALFPTGKLSADGRVPPENERSGVRFTIAIVAAAPGEVDEIAEQFVRAGGRVTKPPTDAEFFVGRSAYVADPEDNFWEIVWAPPDNPVVAAARRASGER